MKRVLIADDSSTMRLFARLATQRMKDVTLTEAGNGRDALEMIKASQFDLIITDVDMPIMNGLELIEQVRILGMKIPIIVLSTYGKDSDVERGMEAGADDYLRKPIMSQAFSNKVQRYIDGYTPDCSVNPGGAVGGKQWPGHEIVQISCAGCSAHRPCSAPRNGRT